MSQEKSFSPKEIGNYMKRLLIISSFLIIVVATFNVLFFFKGRQMMKKVVGEGETTLYISEREEKLKKIESQMGRAAEELSAAKTKEEEEEKGKEKKEEEEEKKEKERIQQEQGITGDLLSFSYVEDEIKRLQNVKSPFGEKKFASLPEMTYEPVYYEVKAIIISEDSRIADINNNFLKEGQWVEGAKVEKIEKNYVILKVGGEEITVPLKERVEVRWGAKEKEKEKQSEEEIKTDEKNKEELEEE